MPRFVDRAELFNRLATIQTEDIEYKTAVYTILGELAGYDPIEVRCKDCRNRYGGLCNLHGAYVLDDWFCWGGEKNG